MLKIVNLLNAPSLDKSYVAAGFDGIYNIIKKLEIMEEPYPSVVDFLTPCEFLLTNFWSMRDDPEGRVNLVKAMIEKRCAGLGIMPLPHLGNKIDPEIVELANRHSFPVIYIDGNARWGDIISEYGVLSHSDITSPFDSSLTAVVEAFSHFYRSGNVGAFCEEFSRIMALPLIMSTDTVYSGGSENGVSVAQVISRIQTVFQSRSRSIDVPVSIRVNEGYMGVVYFGKRSMVAAYFPNAGLNHPSLHLLSSIAPKIVSELDRLCSVPYISTYSRAFETVGDSKSFLVMIRRDNVRQVGKELNFVYPVYEQNTFFNYCILLVPDNFKKSSDFYLELNRIYNKISPLFFAFSFESLERAEVVNQVEALKFSVNSMSYLEGIFSLDELPLLYVLAGVPGEYRNNVLGTKRLGQRFKEEEMAFLITLRIYMIVRNMESAANLLGIHVNSVKYRLSRAMKLLGYGDNENINNASYVKLLMQLELIMINN